MTASVVVAFFIYLIQLIRFFQKLRSKERLDNQKQIVAAEDKLFAYIKMQPFTIQPGQDQSA